MNIDERGSTPVTVSLYTDGAFGSWCAFGFGKRLNRVKKERLQTRNDGKEHQKNLTSVVLAHCCRLHLAASFRFRAIFDIN